MMIPARPIRWMLCLSAAAAACSGDTVEPNLPTFLAANVVQNPANALAGILTVRAAGFDSAAARYWTGTSPAERTPAYRFGPDSLARVPILGLGESATYQIETVVYEGGVALAADTSTLQSGQLPSWIPAMGTIGVDTTPGFLTLSLPDGGVIVDNTGRVVWYAHMPAGVLNSFQAHANGTYTLRDTPGVIHVLNVLGEELGTLDCVGYPIRTHDVMILQDGSRWVMCDDNRIMDLTGVGGRADASVTATVVQHISADGALLFEWNAFDHFALTDLPLADRAGDAVNFTHGNAIELDVDGNVLVSFRSLNEITKIDVGTGDVIWRFGGLASQFTVVNDPKGGFEHQHGVRLAGPSQLQVLDNGVNPPSRLLRYLINPVSKSALLVLEFVDAPATHSPVGGATDYYPDGHGVVSFGRAGRVVEVDAAGNRAWELTGLDGVYVFRAERISSLYHPATLARPQH